MHTHYPNVTDISARAAFDAIRGLLPPQPAPGTDAAGATHLLLSYSRLFQDCWHVGHTDIPNETVVSHTFSHGSHEVRRQALTVLQQRLTCTHSNGTAVTLSYGLTDLAHKLAPVIGAK